GELLDALDHERRLGGKELMVHLPELALTPSGHGGSSRDLRVGMHAERKVLEYEAHVVRCLDHGIERWTGRATRWALEVGKLDDGNGGVGRSLDGRIPDLDLLLGLVREARIVGGLDLA